MSLPNTEFTEKIFANDLEIGQECLVKLTNETSFTKCERENVSPLSTRRPVGLKIIKGKKRVVRGKPIRRNGDVIYVSGRKNVLVRPEKK